jgi:hypothetical protein
MQCEFNESPMTISELRAYHGDAIVGVRYVIDSNEVSAVLEVTVQQKHYTVLRYVSDGEKWHLQAVTIDASEYRKPPHAGVLNDIFIRIDAADNAYEARV